MCVYHFVGVKRILKSRADMIANRQADWALGEAFAVGSLLMEQVSAQALYHRIVFLLTCNDTIVAQIYHYDYGAVFVALSYSSNSDLNLE